MKLKVYGKIYDCDKAVKSADFVKLIKGGVSIAEFSGITSFDGYQIIEGEWSKSALSEIEQLKEIINTLLLDNLKQEGVIVK